MYTCTYHNKSVHSADNIIFHRGLEKKMKINDYINNAKITAVFMAVSLTVTGCSILGLRPGEETTKPTKTVSDTVPDTTTPVTKPPATKPPATLPPATKPPATKPPATTTTETTTPVTTTPPQTTTPVATNALKPFASYMKLNNNPKSWSHGYPDDLSKYNGFYSFPGKNIYLTFDLGYEPGYTLTILDTLKNKGVKATFFLTGTYIEENPEIVAKIKDGGHKIGSHGYNHVNMVNLTKESPQGLIDDFDKWIKAYGSKPELYRAPEGVYSERGMSILKDLGYKTIFWGAAYVDWLENEQPDKATALKTIQERILPGEIVLLHPMKTNTEILPAFIDWAKAQGWGFKQP